ncbi:binding partner of ACD11 1-like [Hevea brasiliensis]|uniref:binding partner of ACD11 1-like n=1 Tax=Hevea brasiliensis TaxID=3981 RepID=UPI000B7993DA|nr:binding partner of ACD11 1-like [Hevea brasiliensis]
MTNGSFLSVRHRALTNSCKSRISMGYFVVPPLNTRITALPQMLLAIRSSLHKPFTWVDYKKGDYDLDSIVTAAYGKKSSGCYRRNLRLREMKSEEKKSERATTMKALGGYKDEKDEPFFLCFLNLIYIYLHWWIYFLLIPSLSLQIRTVKVSNASLGATEPVIKDFFSFSGEIHYVQLHSDNEQLQIAYVTFKDPQAAETAVLLSVGATIVDQSVIIELAPDYQLPAAASVPTTATVNTTASGGESAVQKAEDIVSSMLAKGFILGKDALNQAKAFDEKHQFTSSATSKVTSLDKKIGFREKISAGTTLVNDKVREVDEKFRVSETTKSAFVSAEQTVSNAGSAIMKNRYVLTGASWVTGAFNRVAKTAGEVGQKTKEKVLAEEERSHRAEGYTQIHESDSPNMSEQISKSSH